MFDMLAIFFAMTIPAPDLMQYLWCSIYPIDPTEFFQQNLRLLAA